MATNTKATGTTQFVFGIAIVILLAWLASINDDAGNLAVAIIALLWIVWGISNNSALQSFFNSVGV